MSKVTKRKITVETPSSKLHNSSTLSNKDSQRRQSVFERLGTKTVGSISINTQPLLDNFCRHWNQNGTCPYGKSCVFVNTHTLISPSKRVPKKDLDPKQALARSLEEVEGLKRLHSTVVKRGSPDLNWESWDQTDLEYEDEKVLEKRRQLLQRELELQMKREETEEHHTKRRHVVTKQNKALSSSSSTSVSSTTSDSSSSSDSSSDSSSTSGLAKRRKSKTKKPKRGSVSSVSDSGRKNIRDKSMHKDRSPSNMSRKSASSRDKRAFTPPRKPVTSISKLTARKKSLSPLGHRRHNTPTATSKSKPSTSKSSAGSRPNQSPRPTSTSSKRSSSKDKHKRSLSPRPRSKQSTSVKERSPRRPEVRPRRKDSPASRPRPLDSRTEDRKKDEDRSRNKDDRRQDRKPDRDKRDHEDTKTRDKARDTAREKEREEALERCRERQREREQVAKEKGDRGRDRLREDKEKDSTKQREYEKPIPPLMSLTTHTQANRKISDKDRDRPNKDRKDREKDRDKDKEKERDRVYDRSLDKSDRSRPVDNNRFSEKTTERERIGEKDRTRDRETLSERPRKEADRDRSFERDRGFDRNPIEANERAFDREKERAGKGLDRSRDREFDRDKDRNYERVTENRRSSLEKDRGVVRDRNLERVLELRERNKSLERGRMSDGERSVDRGPRERFDRRALPPEEKGYDRDRARYGADGGSMFKELSPAREEPRGMRHGQGFIEERRGRGGRDMRAGWDARSGFDDSGPVKGRDWDYPDSRRDWDTRNRHGDWEGGMEEDDGGWGRYGGGGGGGGEWGPGDWREEWPQHRPPRHLPRDDQTIISANHIVIRDVNIDDSGRRPLPSDSNEKDSATSGDFKKDISDTGNAALEVVGHKRAREESDVVVEAKKPRLEECQPSGILEEALSDISDDPDEILNREDVDLPLQDCGELDHGRTSRSSAQAAAHELDHRLLEDRTGDEENIDNLDFEEISDEELEEEARANRGLGDALGVDWASLVSETRPRPPEAQPGAARRRWQPQNILARIGVSLQYAGQDLFNQIQQKLSENNEGEEGTKADREKAGLLHPVASLHVALRTRLARRRCLFSQVDSCKRALSARADLAIRRQLCNLPVASLEIQQSSGFCQWVV